MTNIAPEIDPEIMSLRKAEFLAANNCILQLSSNSFTWQVKVNGWDYLTHELNGHPAKNDMHETHDFADLDKAKHFTYYKLIQIAIVLHSGCFVDTGGLERFRNNSEIGLPEDARWREVFRLAAPIAAYWYNEDSKVKSYGLTNLV